MSYTVHLDETLDELEETRFKKKHASLIKKLAKELHFTYEEIESLFIIYYKFQKLGKRKQSSMTKDQFREFLHNTLDITDYEMTDYITTILDKSPSRCFSMELWVRAMSLFLKGTMQEKIDYCFKVYSIMGSDKINRDQVLHLLSHCFVGEEDAEEVVKDLVEIITKKMDVDRDGKISHSDFKATVLNEPLLLEAFGECFPSRTAVYAFLTTFTTNVRKL